MGGYSSEYDISIKSGEVVYRVLKENKDYNFYKIIINKNDWYHIDDKNIKYDIDKNTFEILKNNNRIKFNLVFNTIHGIPGEDGEIQSYLKKLNIKQTSSESEKARLTFNKDECKKVLKNIGINSPNSILLKENETLDLKNIYSAVNLPVFIKPNKGGSSFGISRVTQKKNIINALKKCFNEDNEALIEEEISGREISVGVIKYNGEIIALPPTEIISHNSFFDFNAKYKGESDEITPAKINLEEENMVKKISTEIYTYLGLKGFARSDFILRNSFILCSFNRFCLDVIVS